MARKHRRRKKKPGNVIDGRELLIKKRRAPHHPTQTHDDETQYNRAREKERANKEE